MTAFILLVLFLSSTLACFPECIYKCHDIVTVCPAICTAKTQTPECEVVCDNDFVPEPGQCNSTCTVNVPEDQCPSESCPVAEVECSPLLCSDIPLNVTCELLCEEPVTGWYCRKPTHLECTPPSCANPSDIICEDSICTFSSGQRIHTVILHLLWILPMLF